MSALRPSLKRPICALFWVCSCAASELRAREPPPESDPKLPAAYSDYEHDAIQRALRTRNGRVEPEPEGKLIESIEIVSEDVFDERDPVPDFFNVFHATSRPRVIRRELLFGAGEPYRAARIEESARNLREIRQLSLVLIVPIRGSRKDRVRVLVITKDVWSLRLNSNFELFGSELSYLLLNPSEENLFGTHTSVGGLFILEPDTYSVGALFSHPRIAGSRIQTRLGASLVFNRESGEAEGSFGHFFYGQPLYSLEREWAWKTAIVWSRGITRRFVGLTLQRYRPDLGSTANCAPEDRRCVPYVYSSDRELGAYELIRSFGRRHKHDISFGVEADRRVYRTPDLSAFDPESAADFRRTQVPVSDTRISPFVQLRAYESRFMTVLDFDTLGLQEDYRLGHELILRAYPASSEIGSTRDMLGSLAALSYTVPLGDGLARALASSTIEFEFHERHEASLELGARIVSPRLGFGRFVYDGVLIDRYRNHLNTLSAIGGDSRLRGYRRQFLGKDAVAQNVEFRSRPVEILSAQLGFAAFYDAGDAFDGFEELSFKQSAGLGLRILFPQANRFVFRADWGFPLTPGFATRPGVGFVTFGQAFSMPQLTPPTITSEFAEPSG